MNSSYHTIAQPSEGFYKEKGSKFLSFAFPIDSEEDAKLRLDALKQAYPDAGHHCYAYIIAQHPPYHRAYDDGEPNNAAGVPILNQIRSYGLSNVLAVVVRYFGGTKLGISGLVAAYKTATQEALAQSHIIEKVPHSSFFIEYPYAQTSRVKQLIQQFEIKIVQQDFTECCQAELSLPTDKLEELKQLLKDEMGLKCKF